jgi:glycine betaine catabolism B
MSPVAASGIAPDQDRWLAADPTHLWERARVVAVHHGGSATTLRLRLPTTPELLPGQYYLVRLAIDTVPGSVQQAYSLSSSPFPVAPEVEITVRAVEGGRASPLLAHEVAVGDLIQVRGPYGVLTWTENDGGPLVLIGGGSGVAPLASILRYASARHIGIPMTMLCSSRDRSTLLLREPLQELSRRHAWFELVHTFTRSRWDPYARYHRRIDVPMLAEVMEQARAHVAGASFYVAGPGDMVISVRAALEQLGIPQSSVYSEDHA